MFSGFGPFLPIYPQSLSNSLLKPYNLPPLLHSDQKLKVNMIQMNPIHRVSREPLIKSENNLPIKPKVMKLGKRTVESRIKTEEVNELSQLIFQESVTKKMKCAVTSIELNKETKSGPNETQKAPKKDQQFSKKLKAKLSHKTKSNQERENTDIVLLSDKPRRLKSVFRVYPHPKTLTTRYLVEYDTDLQKNQYVSLTKEELLKEEPNLLVYYYERSLLFPEIEEFDPSEMTKVENLTG